MAFGDPGVDLGTMKKGAPYRSGYDSVISRKCDVDVDAGVGVVVGATGDACKIPTAIGNGATFLGVTAYIPSRRDGGAAVEHYGAGETASIVRKGYIVVETDEAVTAEAAAFLRVAGGNEGQFRTDVDGTDAEAVPAKFEFATAGAGLAVLNLNAP